jgi:hypothetical protein
MVNSVCKKHYPRAFSEETTQGEDGYRIYRRRNDGQTFQKTPNGFTYDNKWVVPHNPYLTKMFNAHINIEVSVGVRSVKMWMGNKWCTQTSLLIMFGKFEKKFGRPDNKEKKLLGECISYIPPLVNVSSSASYLLSYQVRPLSNISELLMTQSIRRFKLLAEHWDYCRTT